MLASTTQSKTLLSHLCVLGVLTAGLGCSSSSETTDATVGGRSGAAGGAAGATAGTKSTSAAGTVAAGGSTMGPTSIKVDLASAQDISPMLYGQNYWNWVPEWGGQVFQVKDLIAPLHVNLLRVGGTYPDIAMPVGFDSAQIDAYVSYCADVGAEPAFQIPFVAMRDSSDAVVPATKEGAAALVEYMNITHDYDVTYFSIGNEPDIYESQGRSIDGKAALSYTAEQYCASFAEYATAMKAVDSTIQILGPELSWKYYPPSNDWLTPFLKNCGDLVDVVTVHRYPFDSTQDTAEAVLADGANFRATLRALRQMMKSAGVGDKPLAITEAHVTWDSDPAKPQLTGAPGTVAAGLWIADSLGVAMEEGLWSLAFWGISEAWTIGFIAGRVPKPEYYSMLTVGKHFRSKIGRVSGAPSGVSVYAGRNDASTPVLFVNKTAYEQAFTIEVQGAPTELPPTSVSVSPYSVTVVELPDDGSTPTIDKAPIG